MKGKIYFSFKGNTAEALEYYKELFKGEILLIQRFKEIPNFSEHPDMKDKPENIFHARLRINDNLEIYFTDSFDSPMFKNVQPGDNVSLVLELDSEEEFRFYYNEIEKDCNEVLMEPKDMFWNGEYASVRDKFGILWHLSYQFDEINL